MLRYLFLLFSCFVRYVQAVGIIIPLYQGPGDGDGCPAWKGYIASIDKYVGVPFYSIVNPSDGPGGEAQPSPSFRACIQLLRPRNTTLVLGYIDTASGQKTEAAVHAEIDLYAGWDREYRPNGIYFDNSPSNSSRVSLYRNHVNYARGKNFLFNGLGAGQTPDTGYFEYADFVTTYESSYSSFGSTDIIISSSTPASKQAAIITEASRSGSYDTAISIIKDKDIRAAYITELDDGNAVPAQWDSFVNALSGTSQLPPTTSAAGETTAPSGTGGPQSSPHGENSNDGPDARSTTGAIAGGVVGGVVAVLIGVGVCIMLRRADRRRKMAVRRDVSPYHGYPLTSNSTSPLAPVRGPPADYSQDNLIDGRSEAHSVSPTTAGLTHTMGLSGSSWNQQQSGVAIASSWGGVSTKGSSSYATSPVSGDDSHRHSIVSSVPPPLYSERPSVV